MPSIPMSKYRTHHALRDAQVTLDRLEYDYLLQTHQNKGTQEDELAKLKAKINDAADALRQAKLAALLDKLHGPLVASDIGSLTQYASAGHLASSASVSALTWANPAL